MPASMASTTWAMTSVDSGLTMWAPRISWVSWSTTSFSAPLGSPRIAARALNARSAVGSPRAGRRPWPARRSGPWRQAAAGCLPTEAGARRGPVRFPPGALPPATGPRRHRPVGQPGWAGHVAGGVDAGRGGALLLWTVTRPSSPSRTPAWSRPSSSTLGRRASAQTTASTLTGRTEQCANRDESRAVEAPPLAIWRPPRPLRQGRVARSSASHAKPAERARATALALSALSEDLPLLAWGVDVKPAEETGGRSSPSLADLVGELRPGELGAEVFRPARRPRGHISVGVELNDAVPGKDGPEHGREDGAIGRDSDRAVAVLHD
jgi:hypothetical protein